ncbi:toxin YoeB [Mucilaginibacter gracilis]|uniref:Putative mRNA interferase YoeB n=1 Tax=Mucilaginibacter gracilis TaxID=423350 RepID=A0A495IXN7_9SPHI|nr:Txe/YoeB family addiction module toxin [Mucilaginibacter gracilis]RKR81332.1 toxin YoeB [Mucilaginibacter gracilis]
MEVILLPEALEDMKFWSKSGNKTIQKKISNILSSIKATPFEGIGKPEPLKHSLSGKWSRRISAEHRLIYAVDGEIIKVYSLKGHYKK